MVVVDIQQPVWHMTIHRTESEGVKAACTYIRPGCSVFGSCVGFLGVVVVASRRRAGG